MRQLQKSRRVKLLTNYIPENYNSEHFIEQQNDASTY